ncbi:hypothetical protein [Streptomyces sp. NPDC002187]
MICARCQQTIHPGEDYVTLEKFSASGVGATLVVHETDCPPIAPR